MKLKYLFSAILASVLLLAGCVQEPIGTFEDIKLSSTNVSIPVEGGEVSVTLTTTKDWAFVTTDLWPNVIAYKTVDDKEVVDEENTEPSWLKLEGPMEGTAGEHTLKFSAEVVSGGRDLTLEIKAGSHSQYITIRQGTKAVENATCADVIAGVDGKVYRVTGVCTKIANDLYGNWYLEDGTGEVYVYGTLDKDGATKNFASWKMAVGDIVTVEGPRKDYNGTIELVDVTVLNIEKSLLKIDEKPEAIAKEGGEYQLTLLYKGLGVQPSVPAVDADGESVDYREWISIVDVETKFAEATKLEPNPADTAFVTIKVLPNDGGARNGVIKFISGTDEASSTVSFEFTQEGSIAEVTVADFLAKEKGDALYKLTGKVSGLKPGDYGNFHLVDATGSVYVYGLTAAPVAKNDKSFPTLGIREGDIVTLIGKRDRYDDAKVPEEKEQVGGPAYYVSHIGSTDVTIAEFLQKPESSDVRYRITGTVANIQMDKNDPTKENAYGNFDLVDGDASVLVYGLTVAPVEKNDQSFPKLGLKAGDVVTIVGTRTAYKDTPQVGGPAYYISHVAGDAPADPAPVAMTIAEAVAQTDSVLVSGTVMALCAKGFMLADETGTAFIYDSGYSQTYEVGDVVKVGGKPGAYNWTNQITPNAKYYEKTGHVEVTYPTPVALDATKIAEMQTGAGNDKNLGVYNPFYVTVEGTVGVSGTYFNLYIDGVDKNSAQGSFYQLTEAQKTELTALNGKAVSLTAYFQAISASNGVPKYFNLVYLTVTEKNPTTDPETPAI